MHQMPPDQRDAALIKAAVAGDADALSELLPRYGSMVRGELSIASKWQSVIEPDDVMQITYIEAYLRIRQLSGDDPRKFLAWLRQIARNNLLDAIRGLECEKRPPPAKRLAPASPDESCVDLCAVLGVTSQTPSRIAGREEARHLVERSLQQLPPQYAQVIRLFDLEGRNGPEVAAAMGRSRGAVFMLLARARDLLREALGSESQFFSRDA